MSVPHKRVQPIKYSPVSAREILTQMKTISELMIDLAYSSLLFSNKELGKWVMELEDVVDRLGYQLFMTLSMSVRSKDDAELSVGLFRVCVAANGISDAAADMASLAVMGQEVHPSIKGALLQVEERLINALVADSSEMNGATIGHILDTHDIGVDIIAVRRDGSWTVNPDEDFVLQSGDVIFVRGTDVGTDQLFEIATGEHHKEEEVNIEDRHSELVRLILRMKETSEFMVSLAYAAVRFDDKDLAQEVSELEDTMDRLHEIVGKETLSLGRNDIPHRWTLLRVATSLEAIADAAWEMAMVPLSGLDTHPIIRAIADEAEEIVSKIIVREGSPLIGKRLRDIALDDRYGLYVLSIKRENHWFHRPSEEFKIQAGDLMIVDGYRTGMEDLRKDILETSNG